MTSYSSHPNLHAQPAPALSGLSVLSAPSSVVPVQREPRADCLDNSMWCTGGAWCGYLILIAIGLFLMVVLTPLSFQYVQYDEVGMKRSVYGTTDTTHILTRGRHYVRPGLDTLVKFDSTFEQVSFTQAAGNSLSVYSNIGVQFSVDVSFYFRVNQSTLGQTYTSYNLGYQTQVINEAPSIIKDNSPVYSVLDFANNRVAVQNNLGYQLQKTLAQQVFVDADATFFTITGVYLPQTTIDANLDSALAVQQNALSQSQQTLQLINQQTNVLVEQVLVQANITLATAQADSNVIVQNSVSEASQLVLSSNGLGLQYAAELLGLSEDQASLSAFVELVAMQQAVAPHVVWGVGGGGSSPLYTLSL